MASFLDTVNALLPVFFFRMDETTGTVLHDSSANEFLGEIFSGAVLGRPSPVETDPASFAIGGPAGRLLIADAPASDFRDNFTLCVFGFLGAEDNDDCILLARNGQLSVNGGNFISFNNGSISAEITIDGTTHVVRQDVSALVRNTWYFIRVTRNSTVLTLHVNEVLADQDTVGTGQIQPGASDGWYFGRAQSANVSHSAGTDEAIGFDYALTDVEGLAIYESALNALFISAVSNVIPTATLNGEEEISAISFPFRHNWDEQLIERITFRTDVSRARTGKEEANAQRPLPRREFEIVQVLRTNAERRRLRALLWRNQNIPWFVPVRQDAQQLSDSVSASATTIPCDTRLRDFEIGSYVGLRQLDAQSNMLYWEEKLITGLTDDEIECEALDQSYSATTTWIYPVRRALVDSSISAKGITDYVEEVRLTFRLLSEDEEIVPHRLTPWAQTFKYRDYEVYDPSLWPSHNWEEERDYEVDREMDLLDFETGIANWESDTIGAAEATPYSLILEGRAVIAQFLGWFYERQGQRRYLWVPTRQEDFEVIAVPESNKITVVDTNYSDSYALAEPRRDLAFINHDKSMTLRRVIAFSGTTNETLTLDASVPDLSTVRSISLLKFSRLDADQIELAWQTDDKVVVSFRFRELLHSPEGTGVSSLSPSASSSTSLSPSHSTSPSPSASTSPSASSSPST